MRGPAHARTELIAASIRDYLARYPRAADSEQGIAAWWVQGTGVQATVEEVAVALEWLRAQGIVERRVLPDGRAIYGTNRGPTAAD